MKQRIRTAMIMAAAICLLAVSTVSASSPIFINITKVDTTAFPTVTAQFSAWDSNGIPLAGLTTQDVIIQEGNNNEIHPATLQADANAELSVVLVLDVSSSMEGQPLADAKAAANRFLDKLSKADQAAVVAFSGDVNTDAASLNPKKEIGFSSDLTGAYDLIEGLTAGGGTEVYNAVEKAVKMAAQLPSGHRAILLFTDGKNDPANVGSVENAITLAKQSNIPVFAIGMGNEIDETYLRQLTSETGGFYRSTPSSSELGGLFTDMAALLKTNYTLTYPSTYPADGQAHSFTLRIASTQGDTSIQSSLGNVPLLTATSTPAQATATITQVVVTPQPTPTAIPTGPEGIFKDKLLLLIAGIVLILLVIIFSVTRKKKVDSIEKCAKCGAVLTAPGACPICGSTKRIKVSRRS